MSNKMNNENESKPNPDPTVYTNEAIERAVNAERDYVDGEISKVIQRFEGLDEATKLARADIKEIPANIAKCVAGLKELVHVELSAINDKFDAAEKVRIEQKQDSKESLDAALTAAKEAVTEQNKSNTESIKKSEAGTSETIKANQESNKAITDGLTKSLDELKLVVNGLVSAKTSQAQTISDARSNRADTRGGFGAIGTVIASGVAVFALLFAAFSYNANKNDATAGTNGSATVVCTESYHPAPCP